MNLEILDCLDVSSFSQLCLGWVREVLLHLQVFLKITKIQFYIKSRYNFNQL